MRISVAIFFIFCATSTTVEGKNLYPLYFATSADTQFFPLAINLISTIHKHHYTDTKEIAVFDLGFKPEERAELQKIDKVTVYDIELTNPDLLVHFQTPAGGPRIRGWYAWKPVAIKQALDLFPYVLYMDAGISVFGPLWDLFEEIIKKGYFLIDCGQTIEQITTETVKDEFKLHQDPIIKMLGISAGFQGLSRKMYNSYVKPMYELSKNILLFADDGTAPNGYGWARHDQALFSIYARKLNLHVHLALCRGTSNFSLGKYIGLTRWNVNVEANKKYLHYR